MARRARHKRETGAEEVPSPASPHVLRRLPHFDPLDEETIIRLEAQVNWLIQEIGIEFRDDPEAHRIWQEAGADVTGTRVRADAGWIRALCAKAPREFAQVARNPERSVVIGGNNQVFAPIYGAPFVRDLRGGRRYGDMESFEKLVKLAYMHPNLHHTGLVICEPCDVPVSHRHLDMVYTHMTRSDKPHLGAITEMSRAQDSVDMAEILHGREFMDENCVIMGNVNTNSPLSGGQGRERGDQGLLRPKSGYRGGSLHPQRRDGAGQHGSVGHAGDGRGDDVLCLCAAGAARRALRAGQFPELNEPEIRRADLWHARAGDEQLCHRTDGAACGLPLRCGGSLTASKIEDAQAAYESADSMHSTMLAGANFVLHAAGWMEGGLCTGFEKLVMDADRLGGYQKLLGGLDTSDEALARDAYAEVEPAGHFLGCGHTMRNYTTAFYEPALSDSENVESWEDGGEKDMRQRAYERWTGMLERYEAPKIDAGTDEALRDYVARRKSEIPEAWY